jgi:hypothetical protein
MPSVSKSKTRFSLWIDNDTLGLLKAEAELNQLPLATVVRLRLRGVEMAKKVA